MQSEALRRAACGHKERVFIFIIALHKLPDRRLSDERVILTNNIGAGAYSMCG